METNNTPVTNQTINDQFAHGIFGVKYKQIEKIKRLAMQQQETLHKMNHDFFKRYFDTKIRDNKDPLFILILYQQEYLGIEWGIHNEKFY